MKNKFTIIGLVCAISLLTSCSADDFQQDNQQHQLENTEFSTVADDPTTNPPVNGTQEGNPLNPKDKG